MLASDETRHAALDHEVVPAADGEAGHVHLGKMQRAVLGAPVVVIVRMLVPLGQQRIVVVEKLDVGSAN